MRVRFIRDFQGVNTGERFYRAGEIADLPAGQALIDEGAAEAVPEPKPARTPKAPEKEPTP